MTNNGRGALRQNGDGVGGSITYDYEGFGIGAAVSSSNVLDDQNFGLNGYGERYLGSGDRAETYTGGLVNTTLTTFPPLLSIPRPTTQLA